MDLVVCVFARTCAAVYASAPAGFPSPPPTLGAPGVDVTVAVSACGEAYAWLSRQTLDNMPDVGPGDHPRLRAFVRATHVAFRSIAALDGGAAGALIDHFFPLAYYEDLTDTLWALRFDPASAPAIGRRFLVHARRLGALLAHMLVPLSACMRLLPLLRPDEAGDIADIMRQSAIMLPSLYGWTGR